MAQILNDLGTAPTDVNPEREEVERYLAEQARQAKQLPSEVRPAKRRILEWRPARGRT